MNRLLAYIFTPFFWLAFGLVILVFHPVQVGSHVLFGDKARKKSVDILNLFLIRCLWIMGTRVRFHGLENIPSNKPVIIISNHQSMLDIPPVVWGFKNLYPRFISKIELAKGIPSISYNLKHGGSALIDRKNRSQAIKEIIRVGRQMEKYNVAVCIYPEGTRSKTGNVKKFQSAGVATLLRTSPSAVVVPFVIDGHSRLFKEGFFPLQFGGEIQYTILPIIEQTGKDAEEIVTEAEEKIRAVLA